MLKAEKLLTAIVKLISTCYTYDRTG